jgi:hypothetical protein
MKMGRSAAPVTYQESGRVRQLVILYFFGENEPFHLCERVTCDDGEAAFRAL